MTDSGTLTDARRSDASEEASLRPHLFVALECDRPTEPSSRHVLSEIDEVVIGRGNARVATREGARLTLRLPDRWLSTTHARIVRAGDTWSFVDPGSKNGSLVNGAETREVTLADGDLVECGHTLFLFRSALLSKKGDRADLRAPITLRPSGLVTLVPVLAGVFDALELIALADVPVVIIGESGTGKELAAHAVHALGKRTGELVAVNCGAIPEHLVESELFGFRRGAFSGATEDRPGLLRAADRGTLFLDEIGDLPLAAQASLLRALQEREVVPVGGTKPIAVDLRIVVATHRDLEARAANGEFRSDLLARLSGFVLRLPPLRERIEDLGTLIGLLLARTAPTLADQIAVRPAAARLLFRYGWPLNIRELATTLARATALAQDGVLEAEHLPDAIREPTRRDATRAQPVLDADDALRADELRLRLVEHNGNVSAVARAMGTRRMQIHRWAKRFAIDLDAFKR